MIYKRGKVYWYKFMWQGKLIRESTKQGNDKVARQMESAHRTSLAKGLVGIREKKPVPTLREFANREFLPWAKATFTDKPKTYVWYRGGVFRLSEHEPIANAKLDLIKGDLIAGYIAHRRNRGLGVTAINRELQILRRILRIAAEWGLLDKAPLVRMLPGERPRDRVLSPEEEARYLAAASEPLASVAIVLADTGMRPEECFRLGWEHISFANARFGTLRIPFGKTAAARRMLPMSLRVRETLEARWERQGRPEEGWVFPAHTNSGHVESSSIRTQHATALRLSKVRPFVLYSLRHTFLTRLGESRCDAWTLARIAGHSNLSISQRYVHPSDDAVQSAMSRLGGHNFRHSLESSESVEEEELLLSPNGAESKNGSPGKTRTCNPSVNSRSRTKNE